MILSTTPTFLKHDLIFQEAVAEFVTLLKVLGNFHEYSASNCMKNVIRNCRLKLPSRGGNVPSVISAIFLQVGDNFFYNSYVKTRNF